nr:MAG TPA: hypothetical protein [Caudoviricetes sp.]
MIAITIAAIISFFFILLLLIFSYYFTHIFFLDIEHFLSEQSQRFQ